MLWQRITSAMVGIPILLGLIYLGGWPLSIAVGIVAIMACWEYKKLVGLKNDLVNSGLTYGICLILLITAFLEGRFLGEATTIACLTFLGAMVLKYPFLKPQEASLAVIGGYLAGWLYGHIILLRGLPDGASSLLFVFLLTWTTDTAAYFSGRAFGRNPMAPQISPKKTMEGLLGGIIITMVVAAIYGNHYYPQISWLGWLLLGGAVAFCGQLGDLSISAIKRMAGVKDTGNLIPGHGGVLDRFDSILFTIPVVYYFFTLVIF